MVNSNTPSAFETALAAVAQIASKDELRALFAAVKRRNSALDSAAAIAFRPGSRVEFTGNGVPLTGIVKSVNTRTVSVLADNGQNWRVSPGLLRHAS